MKKLSLFSMGAALAATLGFALPAAAQMTYNFSDSGNCNFPPATCAVAGTATVASNLAISGWAAASGLNFAAASITDQSGSGIGMAAAGELAKRPGRRARNLSAHRRPQRRDRDGTLRDHRLAHAAGAEICPGAGEAVVAAEPEGGKPRPPRYFPALQPPSMMNSLPVTKADSSPAR